jgi:titin
LYKIYRGSVSGGEIYLADSTTTTYTDYAVVNGQTYYYIVSAVNAVGEGSMSNEVSSKPGGPPGPPRNLVATPGNAQVILTWSAPLEFFGASVDLYYIYRGTTSNGETYLTAVPGNLLTYTDNAVANGVTYYYKVRALNSFGLGPESNEASAMPYAPSAPGPPQNLVATAGSLKVTLTWAAPVNSGSSVIQNYKIYRGTTSNSEVYLDQVGGTVYTYVDQNVVGGTKYYYKVTAVNLDGEGSYSNEASATPTSGTAPTAPLNLVATGLSKAIKLTWLPPTSDGGSPILSWNVWRSTKTGAEKFYKNIPNDGSFTWTDTGLRADAKYFYKIAAVNAIGPGPLSNEASATVLKSSPPVLAPIDGGTGALAYAAVVSVLIAAFALAWVWRRMPSHDPAAGSDAILSRMWRCEPEAMPGG